MHAPVSKLASVRPMTPDDVEWGLAISRQYYEGAYDENNARLWAHARLLEPNMVFLRSDHVLGVAHLAQRFQAPERMQAYLTLLYAEPGNYGREVLRVIQALKEWAVSKKAGKFWLSDVTGHDMGAVVKLVGGRLAGHTYVVDLDGSVETLG